MLASEARKEKIFQDTNADYQANKLKERNERQIKYYQSKIEEEKEAIKDCLSLNFFSIEKSKIERIERIEEMTNKINSLR